MRPFLAILMFFLLAGCAPAETATPTPQLVSVYASAAAQPWLAGIYTCAEQTASVIRLSTSESAADIYLRVGEPENLTTPAYQIDSEDILIVTHRESPIQNLTAEAARALFSNPEGQAVQIWVFASGEDIQATFERQVLSGQPVTSLARLAASPQQMSDTLNAEKNAVGILPRHWETGSVREVFTLADVPVLALTSAEPQGVIKDLIACWQQKTAP